MAGFRDFFLGTPERFEQKSMLGPEQQGLYKQLLAAGQGRGAGGAFGQAGDYYRDLLSNESEDFDAFAAPELRRFRQETIPGLAEQFAGMGAGNLSSSAFRNASINAGTDLSERLGAIRAQLRQQGAQGLMGIGQQGLQQTNENIFRPGTEGFLSQLAPILGQIGGNVAGMPLGGALTNWLNPVKGTSSFQQNSQVGTG